MPLGRRLRREERGVWQEEFFGGDLTPHALGRTFGASIYAGQRARTGMYVAERQGSHTLVPIGPPLLRAVGRGLTPRERPDAMRLEGAGFLTPPSLPGRVRAECGAAPTVLLFARAWRWL